MKGGLFSRGAAREDYEDSFLSLLDLLEGVWRKGCGPREEGNLRFGFWNLEIILQVWIYRSDQGATEKAWDCEH